MEVDTGRCVCVGGGAQRQNGLIDGGRDDRTKRGRVSVKRRASRIGVVTWGGRPS